MISCVLSSVLLFSFQLLKVPMTVSNGSLCVSFLFSSSQMYGKFIHSGNFLRRELECNPFYVLCSMLHENEIENIMEMGK